MALITLKHIHFPGIYIQSYFPLCSPKLPKQNCPAVSQFANQSTQCIPPFLPRTFSPKFETSILKKLHQEISHDFFISVTLERDKRRKLFLGTRELLQDDGIQAVSFQIVILDSIKIIAPPTQSSWYLYVNNSMEYTKDKDWHPGKQVLRGVS